MQRYNVPLSNGRVAQYNTERIVGGEHDGRLLSEMTLDFIMRYADLETPDEVVLMPRTRDAAIYFYHERRCATHECVDVLAEWRRNDMLINAANGITVNQKDLVRTVLRAEAKEFGYIKAQAVASAQRLLAESNEEDKRSATLRNYHYQQRLKALEMLQRDPEYCTEIVKAHEDVMKL